MRAGTLFKAPDSNSANESGNEYKSFVLCTVCLLDVLRQRFKQRYVLGSRESVL